MNFSIAYELRICSDLEIPELLPWPDGSKEAADVHIYEAIISEEEKQSLPQVGPFLFVNSDKVLLTIPNIAVFLIESGKKISYQKLNDSNEDDVRIFLLGSCIGALLMQRTVFVLHGSCIQVGDGCIACVGHSTAGKSSLAAAFMQSGYPIISDDICAIDQHGQAIPGIPRIKINQDMAKKLNIDTNGLRTIRANYDNKFSLPLDSLFCTERLPLLAIYELAPDKGEVILHNKLTRFDAFSTVHRHLYRPRYTKAMDKAESSLKRCSELAENTQVSRIQRPMNQSSAEELRELILQNLKHISSDAVT